MKVVSEAVTRQRGDPARARRPHESHLSLESANHDSAATVAPQRLAQRTAPRRVDLRGRPQRLPSSRPAPSPAARNQQRPDDSLRQAYRGHVLTRLQSGAITTRRILPWLAALVALLVVGTIIGLIWADTSDVAGAFAVVTNIVSVVGIVLLLIAFAVQRRRQRS